MKIFAIGDLHLSTNSNKPMNVFGGSWENYVQEIETDWNERVTEQDIVLIPGDISWAMKLEDALADLQLIAGWKGKKIILKGNHDYWWNSLSALNEVLPENMVAIQNNAFKFGNVILCGSRGWTAPEEEGKHKTPEDQKIYERELIRLGLSLQMAQKLKTDEQDIVIAMLHYPPYNAKHEDSAVTKLLEKYGVSYVVYGHLHNDFTQDLKVNKNGISYFLTSCDLVKNKLVEIYETA